MNNEPEHTNTHKSKNSPHTHMRIVYRLRVLLETKKKTPQKTKHPQSPLSPETYLISGDMFAD